MEAVNKKTGGRPILVILAVAVVAVLALSFLVFPSFFACIGQTCGNSGVTGGLGGTTQTLYLVVDTARSTWGGFSFNAQVALSSSGTGETIGSCSWVVCQWVTGDVVTITMSVSGAGINTLSCSASPKMGLGDHEEYVCKLPNLPTGSYTATVMESAGHFYGAWTQTKTAQFAVVLQSPVNLQ